MEKVSEGKHMKMDRIVVGVDGSPESARALEWAADLAAVTGAAITAVTVLDTAAYTSWGVAPTYPPDFDQLRTELNADLESWCQPLRTRGLAHRTVLREGSAAGQLLNEADSDSADLIVMGSRGRGGFRELLLGSVAHQVTQHSTHPVVVLPRAAVRATLDVPTAAAATA